MRFFRLILWIASAGALSALAGAAPPFSSGPPTGMASNRPYYNNCTVCHSGTVNSGSGSVVLTGVPMVYTPGSTYLITVTDTDMTAKRWGFELIAQRSNGSMGGAFSLTDLVNTQLVPGGGGLDYIMHTTTGTYAGMSGPRSWSVNWTAPPLADGDIAFTVSGNCANNNSFNNGDKIYNGAVMSAAPDGSIPDALLIGQPNLTNPRRSSSWIINGRVRNTLGVSATYDVVTRIRMPNGSYYPPTGWFGGPLSITLAAGASGSVRFTHTVPTQAPLITATYEMYLRTPAGAVVYQDSFVFTVAP